MTLLTTVEHGDVRGVLRELAVSTPTGRGTYRDVLAARRTTTDLDWAAAPGDEWHDPRIAQLAAELGCQEGPADAAAWFGRPDNRLPLDRYGWGLRWLPDVLSLRPVAWRAGLVALLAERVKFFHEYTLIEYLVHDTGCPVPTTRTYLRCWLESRCRGWEHPAHLRPCPPGAGPVERLRNDPLAPRLLPLIIGDADVGLSPQLLVSLAEAEMISRLDLAERCFAGLSPRGWTDNWLDALRVVTADPVVHAEVARQRLELFDQCVTKLLDGGSTKSQRMLLGYLQALALTPQEQLPRVGDHLAMLELDTTVAGFAQQALAGLDAADLVGPDLLTEASERMLRRPEKKLVRAQLSWLDRAARRDPARAGRVVLAAAVAFEHPDPAVQEMALTTVTRHLPAAGDAVLPALRSAAEWLDPVHAVRAGRLLGEPPGAPSADAAGAPGAGPSAGPPVDLLPVVEPPEPVADPIATVAEVAEEVAAVLAGDQSVAAFERAIDGLVRHAHVDPAGLAAALRPVVRGSKVESDLADCLPLDLREVATAVTGDEPPRWSMRVRRRHLRFAGPGELLAARIDEAAAVARAGKLPFLLATPTLATGALDAAVLVARVATYERAGVDPGPYDLAQALLRVTPTTDPAVLSTADALRSDAGRQVATWLRAGGIRHQESRPESWARAEARQRRRWWVPVIPAMRAPCPLPPHAMNLLLTYDLGADHVFWTPRGGYWVAQLPHHRDEIAARAFHLIGPGEKGVARLGLPLLARSGGPAGYALHLVLAQATGISATEQPQDHLAAVDAVLTMAARGDLDRDLLGRQIAVLVRAGELVVNRVVATVRAMAATGAPATGYAILRAALPGVLGDRPAHGAGGLLALAAECAVRCRATDEIAEVTALAARKGSSQLVKNARALRDATRPPGPGPS